MVTLCRKNVGRVASRRARDAIISVTGLLGFFSLDTLVDLFTMDRDFFRGVYADAYLVALHP